MLIELKNAIVALLVMTVITGIIYPLSVTGIAQVVFNKKANGSLIEGNNGSELIGQTFDDPKYFWGRLSGCGYNAGASSGTNYSMLNPALIDAAKTRIAALKNADPNDAAPIPVDLVTASGSGLDPHISVSAARYQAARVARVRNIDLKRIEDLIAARTEHPTFGVLGAPRVNVVMLNRSLDLK